MMDDSATYYILPPASDAPPEIEARLLHDAKVEYQTRVSQGVATHRFPERSRCEIEIDGVREGPVQAWVGGQERTAELHRFKDVIYWPLNWGDYVGLSRLRIEVAGQPILDLPVEIYSRKLDYQQDYRRLLDELAEWLAALAFSVATPTALPTEAVAPEQGSLYLAYLIIRRLMQPQRLPAAFERVRLEPHRRLVREGRRVDFAQARQLDARALIGLATSTDLARAGSVLSPTAARLMRGYAPTHLLDTRPRTDLDTPENRFVSHLLRTLTQRLALLEQSFWADAQEHAGRADLARSLAENCRRWGRQLGEMERAPFLEEVGAMTVFPAASQVLQRREGYRELRDAYLRLLLSPHVRWAGLEALLTVPSRDVPTLYEYWCFFALADALARAVGIQPDWRDLVNKQGNLWEIWLQQGLASKLTIGPATLWYNRGFSRGKQSSYSLPLRPDYTIELDGRRWLFDAKYRLKWEDLTEMLDQEDPDETDREATFKRADLYKMHTYRDAIRRTEAVFILYPGTRFRAYAVDGAKCEDPAGLTPSFSGVGAIPLYPGRAGELEAVTRMLLRSSEQAELEAE